jgi:hypothetical protein
LVPFSQCGRYVVWLEYDVELTLCSHNLGDQKGFEIAVVVLGENEAFVGLGDVTEKIDPVTGGD